MTGAFVLKYGFKRRKARVSEYRDFISIAGEIIYNPSYQRLKGIRHHDGDIYTHNMSVAWISFLIAVKLNLRVREVVRGALLHDFFFYDWRTGAGRKGLLPHGFTHPSESCRNAAEVFGPLTSVEKDIIVKHMWPLTIVPPLYAESYLVSFVDKAAAGAEAVKSLSRSLFKNI